MVCFCFTRLPIWLSLSLCLPLIPLPPSMSLPLPPPFLLSLPLFLSISFSFIPHPPHCIPIRPSSLPLPPCPHSPRAGVHRSVHQGQDVHGRRVQQGGAVLRRHGLQGFATRTGSRGVEGCGGQQWLAEEALRAVGCSRDWQSWATAGEYSSVCI